MAYFISSTFYELNGDKLLNVIFCLHLNNAVELCNTLELSNYATAANYHINFLTE